MPSCGMAEPAGASARQQPLGCFARSGISRCEPNGVAFELQCQVRGGPKARTIEDLKRIASGSASRASIGTRLRTGAKLIREWQGRTWTVEVIDGGFLMAGERYVSLSAIARKITGARWSGPRFFGLAEEARRDDTPTKLSHRRKAA